LSRSESNDLYVGTGDLGVVFVAGVLVGVLVMVPLALY
jgi:hypothetical protein